MSSTTPDAPAGPRPRQSAFDRLRGPLALLVAAAVAIAASYYAFLQKKTEYFTDRDARLITRAAQQVARLVNIGAAITRNAVTLQDPKSKEQSKDVAALYKIEGRASDEQRLPSKIFRDINTVGPTKPLAPELTVKPYEHRYATRENNVLLLNFEVLAGENHDRFASGQIELQQLLEPLRRSLADVFDAFFIVDASGDVIYQAQKAVGEESGSDMKLVRLPDLTVTPMFEKPQPVKVAQLTSVSRQLPIRLGDNDYQLFSVPIASTIHIENAAHEKGGGEEKKSETWVVCGLVSTSEFRARSLQISVTLLSCLAGALLLVICSWPFVKMALASAPHKTTLFDVILLGMCGILASAIVSLAALDWLTFGELQRNADDQLERLAKTIERKFNADIATAIGQLDELEPWAVEQQLPDKQPLRQGDLLSRVSLGKKPLLQVLSLMDGEGQQTAKWSVDHVAPPLIRAANRPSFSSPLNKGPGYLAYGGRHVTIESVRSPTTGQTEVVFSRAVGEMHGFEQSPRPKEPAVITMSAGSALSVMNAVVPEDFGFAVIDANGTVLFHTLSERNTVENFFAEADQNPKLRAIVAARQSELVDLRYWGDDYRAYVYPLKGLPWTLVTFRAQSGLRALNTEALLTTMLFLLVLHFGGLLSFICIVLVLRPRYRAAWLWPDPNRVDDYRGLAAAYIALLAAGGCFVAATSGAALAAFPYAFVPLVLTTTYVYIRGTQSLRAKALLAAGIAAAIVVGLLPWSGTREDTAAVAAKVACSFLVAGVLARAALRPRAELPPKAGTRERQTELPLAYVSAGTLLLLLVSFVPTAAFFRAAIDIDIASYVKYTQIQLAHALQGRWWHLSAEFSDDRGMGKRALLGDRWKNVRDLHFEKPGTWIAFDEPPPAPSVQEPAAAAPWFESILPTYSEASVNTREMLHDRSADGQWTWTRAGSTLTLAMSRSAPVPGFTIHSQIPSPFLAFGTGGAVAVGALSALAILALVFGIAEFVARRVFLVDLVNPLWLPRGFLGLRHVICHPCDDAAVERLFANFAEKLDLDKPEDVKRAETAPQSFPQYAPTVFINHLGYDFAVDERAKVVRGLLERLMRNPDRVVVIRPTTIGVIAQTLLDGTERAEWRPLIEKFVWVNATQINVDKSGVNRSGSHETFFDMGPPGPAAKEPWLKRMRQRLYRAIGFGGYFEQIVDANVAQRTIKQEVKGDPYVATLIEGLQAEASGRDQVLDEIGERAEQYYIALWNSCKPRERLVLMQVAETGLVNGKARKEVRRLLARGLLQRNAGLGVMNETFRRFVHVQASTSALARQLQDDLASDAWRRFRVPFFVALMVIVVFFFGTQRELFDSTFAVAGGFTATATALLKLLSTFGDRSAAKAA